MLFIIFLYLLYITIIFAKTIPDYPNIQGTWQTQSKTVKTGPNFYNYNEEILYEPNHPGISYSFNLKNMKYESSQYLIYSNPINHSCPKAKLIWHHGEIKFEKINSKNENRYKIILNSIKNDGRQLISEPCLNAFAEYTRYNTPQEIWKLNLEWDNYLKNWKLILYNDEPIEFKNNIVDDEFGFYNLGLKKIVMWLDNDSDDVSSNMLPSKFKNKKKIFVDV